MQGWDSVGPGSSLEAEKETKDQRTGVRGFVDGVTVQGTIQRGSILYGGENQRAFQFGAEARVREKRRQCALGEAEFEHPKIMPTGRQRRRPREPRCCGSGRGGRGGFPGGLRMSTWQGEKGEPREWQGISRVSVVSQIHLYRFTANKILPLTFPHLIL